LPAPSFLVDSVSEQLGKQIFAFLGSLFGIWFNQLKNFGSTSSQINMQLANTSFKRKLVPAAHMYGPQSLKKKMFLKMAILGERGSDLRHFGSATGALLASLGLFFLTLISMICSSPLKMFSLLMTRTQILSIPTYFMRLLNT